MVHVRVQPSQFTEEQQNKPSPDILRGGFFKLRKVLLTFTNGMFFSTNGESVKKEAFQFANGFGPGPTSQGQLN